MDRGVHEVTKESDTTAIQQQQQFLPAPELFDNGFCKFHIQLLS